MRLQTEYKCTDGRIITVRAFAADVLKMLGINGKKLPPEAREPVIIQGVKVWVTPYVERIGVDRWSGKAKRIKSSAHRVMAECPNCGKHLSAGRLHQHKCK